MDFQPTREEADTLFLWRSLYAYYTLITDEGAFRVLLDNSAVRGGTMSLRLLSVEA